MITEQDLREAIAECEGARNPNANTCIKLAAFYTIQQHMFGDSQRDIKPIMSHSEHSYADGYESNTEFAAAVKDMRRSDLMKIMDELMLTLQIVEPKLYQSVMRELEAV